MHARIPHLDANESIFFERALAKVKAETYDVKYPNLKARSLFPISEESPGALSIVYQQFDAVGMAKVINHYGDDIPLVNLKGKEFTSNVRTLAAGYMFSTQDVRSAAMGNLDLETRNSNAAKRAIMQLEDKITFDGDEANNIPGLLTNTNITVLLAPKGAGAATTRWATKTADEIVADLEAVANAVVETSLEVHTPNTLLMPLEQFNLIKGKRMGATNDVTVLKFFMDNNVYIKEIVPVPALKGKGAAGSDVIIAYEKSPMVCELQIPMDFQQGDMEVRSLKYMVPCEERFAGLHIYYPLAFCRMEGV